MLIWNIYIEFGLVNSVMGIISDILYEIRNGYFELIKIYVLFDN